MAKNDWWNRTLIISTLYQTPGEENHFTTGWRKLIAVSVPMSRRLRIFTKPHGGNILWYNEGGFASMRE